MGVLFARNDVMKMLKTFNLLRLSFLIRGYLFNERRTYNPGQNTWNKVQLKLH